MKLSVFFQTSTEMKGLSPNSLYQVEISGQTNGRQLRRTFEAVTMEAAPQVRPNKRDNCSTVLVQAIRFCWAPPSPAPCQLGGGKTNGYR